MIIPPDPETRFRGHVSTDPWFVKCIIAILRRGFNEFKPLRRHSWPTSRHVRFCAISHGQKKLALSKGYHHTLEGKGR
jgi:hypothetical protein